MIRHLTLAAVIFAAAVPAYAEDGARNSPPPRKVVQVDVFGTDPCPKGPGDEIVVCARLPESERYRIPKPLRQQKVARKEQSWVARTRDIEETGRAQRPNSCSAVGTGGQTGCWEQFMRDSAAQKAADAAGSTVP
nr:hypothetical protein [Polymorphobacter sp.]